jgi:DNA-binding CsgD family transcriptional regulator
MKLLRRSQRRQVPMRAVLDALPDAAGFLAWTGEVVLANRAFERLLASSRAEPSVFRALARRAREPRPGGWRVEYVGGQAVLARVCVIKALHEHPVLVVVHRAARVAALFEPHASLRLPPRQAAVARLLARGLSNAAIAAELGVSASTARRHTEQVFARLRVHSRAQVAARLAELSGHD